MKGHSNMYVKLSLQSSFKIPRKAQFGAQKFISNSLPWCALRAKRTARSNAIFSPLLNKVTVNDWGVTVSLAAVAFAIEGSHINFNRKAQCKDIRKLGDHIAPELNKVVRHVAASCTLLALGQR